MIGAREQPMSTLKTCLDLLGRKYDNIVPLGWKVLIFPPVCNGSPYIHSQVVSGLSALKTNRGQDFPCGAIETQMWCKAPAVASRDGPS